MTLSRSPFLLVAACAAALAALAGPSPALADEGDLIVRYATGVDARERADVRDDAGVVRVKALALARTEVVAPEPGTSVAEAVSDLQRAPEVLSAEPDAARAAFRAASDDYFFKQWGLSNTGQFLYDSHGSADADIDATGAWETATDSSAVTVGVIDSGVDAGHPDLDENLLDTGFDFVDRDADPADTNGHGTHVTGTIGAEGDNAIGVSGVAWDASLLPLRALGANGSGTVSDEIEAIAYAATTGARVVNMSLGGETPVEAERAAMQAASNVLFVIAAGNDGDDNDAIPTYPCAYDLVNVICVAASDASDHRWSSTNYGATTVDLAAPGVDILSTWPGSPHNPAYVWLNGTSMATPHVAGAAALVLAQRPELTPWQLGQVLLSSTDRLDAFAGRTVSGGRLNVAQALTQPAPDATREPTVSAPGTLVETLPSASGEADTPTPTPTPATTPTPASPRTSAPGAAPTAPAPDRAAPALSIALGSRGALGRALSGRLSARAGCSERCTVRVELRVDARTARALRLGRAPMRIATGTASLRRAGIANVTVRLTGAARAALRRARSVRVKVRATATDASGNRRTRSRAVTLRR